MASSSPLDVPHKAVVLLSGGLDSTVLLFHLMALGTQVQALSIDYNQRHKKELEAASEIARKAGVPHQVADLSGLAPLLTGSALTSSGIEVPLGHYEDETMKLTVVPNRNMILLSVATAWAVSTKSDVVAYAAHGGDHAIYPDCRAEFADALAVAIALCDWHKVALIRPFVTWTKADIARRGIEVDAPMALTWSCYQGGRTHCGQCGTCVERREAFQIAGVPDPTDYRSAAA